MADTIFISAPEEARTTDSILILCGCEARIFINGQLAGTTKDGVYTAESLQPGTEYKIFAEADSKRNETIAVRTKPVSEIYDIRDYGAVGDGRTINTDAVQSAIDDCRDGGTVYVPPGVFVTGAVFLKNHMTLFVDKGGILLGSDNAIDYPIYRYRFEGMEQDCYASLINVKDGEHEDISICGEGTIDANGANLKKSEEIAGGAARGRAVCIRNADRVYLKDITVRQSPAWCVHTIYCKNVTLNNVKIHTKYNENGERYEGICNGDGFDPDSCENVRVVHSLIESQDDCIAIKSGKNEEGRRIAVPSRNVNIIGCTFRYGFGVAVGSEMSGGVSNVLVRGCRFEDTYSIASVKPPRGRGGRVENIVYEDCSLKNASTEFCDCEWFRGAINIDMYYSHKEFDALTEEDINEGTPEIDGVILRNITASTVSGNAVFIAGLAESPIKNLTLENVTVNGKYGMKIYNVDGLDMKNVKYSADEGNSIEMRNVITRQNVI